MNNKIKNRAIVISMGLLIFGLALVCWFKAPADYSDSERRTLALFPDLSWKTVSSGEFMSDFENYSADQFPLRDSFRTVKTFSSLKIFNQLDTDGLYEQDGYLAKMEYPLSEKMLTHATDVFSGIHEKFLKDTDVSLYLSIVPDKNYFLAKESGRLSLDYELLVDTVRENTAYMKYIDIFPLIELEDYYYTDTHWRQENLTDVADKLAENMGVTLNGKYETKTLDNTFYGVYYGQLALPAKPDEIRYLTNEILEGCTVTSYATGSPKPTEIYNMEKAFSKDPYEMYLGGADPIVVIENPASDSDNELVIFRDSFGSSIAPLFVEAYSKVTLVDVRYVNSSVIGSFVEFTDQDVLFLYSTLILNSSLALK